MKLYLVKNSCALACHIVLEEIGVDYDVVFLDILKGDLNTDAFTAINAKRRVPALITQSGTLTETPAILVYLAQIFPEKNLAPLCDPFRFGFLQSFNSYLCSTVHVAHAHGIRGKRWAREKTSISDMQTKVQENMEDCFDLIEEMMTDEDYILGNEYSIGDPYLLTMARYAVKDGVNLSTYPKVNRHMNNMKSRPAVQKVLELHSSRSKAHEPS